MIMDGCIMLQSSHVCFSTSVNTAKKLEKKNEMESVDEINKG